jgi:hypothetical protein
MKRRYVFISYSNEDAKFALDLSRELEEEKIDTWVSYKDLIAGSTWDVEIEKAIENCSAFCLIVSSNSVKSNFVKAEVEKALKVGKSVFPIQVDKCDLPLRWNMLHVISWDTIGMAAHRLKQYLPLSTKNEFLYLIDHPDKEEQLKDLIKTYFEWIPDNEIRFSGRRYGKRSECLKINRPFLDSMIDISLERPDSNGDNCTYVYLGTPFAKPYLPNGEMGLEFKELINKVECHASVLAKYDEIGIVVIFGRRKDWTGKPAEFRRELTGNWKKRFLHLSCKTPYLTIMSYDRLVDNVKELN